MYRAIEGKLNKNFIHQITQSSFARKTAGSFGLKIVYTGLMFGTSLLVTRFLGAESFGAYMYVIAWTNFLVVIATLGLDQLLIREIAIYLEGQNWSLFSGLLRWTNTICLLISIGLAALIVAVTFVIEGVDPEILAAMRVGMILLPIVTLTRLRQGTMRGLYKVLAGQMPEMLLLPGILIVFILAVYVWRSSWLGVQTVLLLHISAAAMAFVIGSFLLNSYLPQAVKQAQPTYKIPLWLQSAWPLLLFGGMRVVDARIDTIMLGLLTNAASVGIYAAVTKGAELISFILIAFNAVLAPTIARLYANGQMQRLQRVITISARIIFLGSLPVALGLIIFGRYFLGIFGPEFTSGYTALTIISSARLFNAAVGPVALLLIMTGFEKDVAWGVGLGALLNVILNIALIPHWGINGAAVATASGTLFWDVVLTIRVLKRLGIDSTILGTLSRQHAGTGL